MVADVEQDFWMSILLDVGIGLEINVLTSKFILLGDQMLSPWGVTLKYASMYKYISRWVITTQDSDVVCW